MMSMVVCEIRGDWVVNSRGTWSSIIKVGKEIDRLGLEFTSSFGLREIKKYVLEIVVVGIILGGIGDGIGSEIQEGDLRIADQSWPWLVTEDTSDLLGLDYHKPSC
ncbi:hypothetical protein Tco_1177700 [Tanacetum coccineum]